MTESLVDRIYEAAFVPEHGCDVLAMFGAATGSASGSVVVWTDSDMPVGFRTTPLTQTALESFIESANQQKNEHVLPLRRAAYEVFSGGDLLIVATAVRVTEWVPSPNILMGLFDLTPAEVKLAIALAAGRTVQQAATDSAIQLSSARTYLDRIFRKTGTHQQSQLVALLKSAQPFTIR